VRLHEVFVIVRRGEEPSPDWEHDEYRWCRADEAAALLHWPEPREVLQELVAR
jgi:8-oxo-dGTP pyrophosphatase MutT (NUDIX family)